MIEISNVDVYGFEAAIRGMRNPMNSWEKSDSLFLDSGCKEYRDILNNSYSNEYVCEHYDDYSAYNLIGQNDTKLMKSLRNAGKDHAKYRRMITVSMDILAPLYWWKEFDTYKVGTVANSCSTMHKIHAKPFREDDFSHEHLFSYKDAVQENDIPKMAVPSPKGCEDEFNYLYPENILDEVIIMLNECRHLYLQTNDKRYWWQMIQLLPSSYNQKRTVMLNYEVLSNIYPARRDHKLDEWHKFCDWIETLPESWIIIGDSEDERIEKLYSTVHVGAEVKVCGEKHADEAKPT